MEIRDWRKRLESAIDADGRSRRRISLDSRMGPGYVHSILKEGKDPTIDSLVAICETLNISLTKVLYGIEISRETEEILTLVQDNPQQRQGILQILRNSASP